MARNNKKVKNMKVECPKCAKIFNYYTSEYRPFCSEKCKMVDLGHWLSESYTVPATQLDDEEVNALEEALNADEK